MDDADALLFAAANLPGNLLAAVFLDKVKRSTSLITSIACASASLVIFAALLCQALGQSCFDDYIKGTQAIIKFDECKKPSNGKEIDKFY